MLSDATKLWLSVVGHRIVLPEFVALDSVTPPVVTKSKFTNNHAFATLVPRGSCLVSIIITAEKEVFLFSPEEPHVVYCTKHEWKDAANIFPPESTLIAFLYADKNNTPWFGIFDALQIGGQCVKEKQPIERHEIVFNQVASKNIRGFRHHWSGFYESCKTACHSQEIPFHALEIMVLEQEYLKTLAPIKTN